MRNTGGDELLEYVPKRVYRTHARGCVRMRRVPLTGRAPPAPAPTYYEPHINANEADNWAPPPQPAKKRAPALKLPAWCHRTTEFNNRPANYLPEQHFRLHIAHMAGAGCSPAMLGEIATRLIALRIDPAELTLTDLVRHMEECGIPSTRYNMAPYVLYMLQGRTPPTLTSVQIEVAVRRHNAYRETVFRLSQKYGWGARNGAPVQFVLYKIAQMEGWEDYAALCRLYTTQDHGAEAEKRWKVVCGARGWVYVPTPTYIARAVK